MNFAGKTFGVALAASLMGTVGAFASTIDLTDNGSYVQGTTSASGSVDGTTWVITPKPTVGPLTYTAFDGGVSTAPADVAASKAAIQALNPDLALENDGIGIVDDEVTYKPTSTSNESLTITFADEVTVDGIYVLDLFGAETTLVYSGTTLVGTITAMSGAGDNSLDGYSYIAFSTGVTTTSLTFKAGPNNDAVGYFGKPDFALAAITLAPIPVPAAGLLLLGGLGALGAAKRRRKA